eukprot:2717393-Pyramimonas_sp.AAC.1
MDNLLRGDEFAGHDITQRAGLAGQRDRAITCSPRRCRLEIASDSSMIRWQLRWRRGPIGTA